MFQVVVNNKDQIIISEDHYDNITSYADKISDNFAQN